MVVLKRANAREDLEMHSKDAYTPVLAIVGAYVQLSTGLPDNRIDRVFFFHLEIQR